jgi:hypothetical protein
MEELVAYHQAAIKILFEAMKQPSDYSGKPEKKKLELDILEQKKTKLKVHHLKVKLNRSLNT